MHSSGSAPLLVLLFLFVLPLLLSACSGEDARGEIPLPELASSSVETSRAGVLDVVGLLENEGGRPLPGRTVVLVDARGAKRSLVTDHVGRFRAAGVAAPYDVAIAPHAHLGLSLPDPRVVVAEQDEPAEHVLPRRTRIVVKPPRCASAPCWVAVVCASPSGEGAGVATAAYDRAAPLELTVEHAVDESEPIEIQALAVDDRRSSFAYARRSGGRRIEPAAVEATAPVAFIANAPGVSGAWQWTTTAWLDLPGGGTVPLAHAFAPELATRLPRIAGASIRVRARADYAPFGPRPEYHRWAEGWSPRTPASVASDAVIEVAAGPDLLRPSGAGSLPVRAIGFAWSAPPETTLSTLVVSDVVRGIVRLRAVTTESEIPEARLAALGLPELLPGPHSAELSTRPVSTSASTSALAARQTYQRAPFEVTP